MFFRGAFSGRPVYPTLASPSTVSFAKRGRPPILPARISQPAFTTTTYLLAARALRDFGDGFVAVLLPAYLLALGFSPLEVGIIATAALLGSALVTMAVGFLG